MTSVVQTSTNQPFSSQEDCYFYYNASCTKGDSCRFRHEPAALETTIPCKYFAMGCCTMPKCAFRHSISGVNNPIVTNPPCYYESQPGGCKKAFCPFVHKTKESIFKKSNLVYKPAKSPNTTMNGIEDVAETPNTPGSERSSVSPNLPVRNIIVSLNDGESDSEGGYSPVKRRAGSRGPRPSNVADLEKIGQIHLKEKEVLDSQYLRRPLSSNVDVVYRNEDTSNVRGKSVESPYSQSCISKRVLEDDGADLRQVLLKAKRQKLSVFDRIRKPEKSDTRKMSRSADSNKERGSGACALFQRSLDDVRKSQPKTDLRAKLKPKSVPYELPDRLNYRTRCKEVDLDRISIKSLDEIKASKKHLENTVQDSELKSKITKVDRNRNATESNGNHFSEGPSQLRSEIVLPKKHISKPTDKISTPPVSPDNDDTSSWIEDELLIGDSLMPDEDLDEDALLY